MFLLLLASVLLIVSPLAGLLIRGGDPRPYLEFPPLTRYVEHAGFSWPVFLLMGAGTVGFCIWFYLLPKSGPVNSAEQQGTGPSGKDSEGRLKRFPPRGRLGLVLMIAAWVAAWTRPGWLGPLVDFTFTPLWFGFILVLDGLVYVRRGESMWTRSPLGFVLLFPISAVAWWFFEYLNRFVQNWYYEGVSHFNALGYALAATPPFSTVLPAIFESAELIGSFGPFQRRYRDMRVSWRPPAWVLVVLILAGVGGLVGVSHMPNAFYPMLWLAPLFIMVPLLHLGGTVTPFSWLGKGDGRALVHLSLAALLCGFFWEMWNVWSLPKWHYSVPFVQRFHLFEMPLLGYAGYLPFGIECYCLFLLVRHAWPLDALHRLNPGNFEL